LEQKQRRIELSAKRPPIRRRKNGGKLAANQRQNGGPSAAVLAFDRSEDRLVLAFCSFLMKADYGESGKNLCIPRWQQQLGHKIVTTFSSRRQKATAKRRH
jgi:hypothetical protein